jgi:hypothetical protein
MLIPVDIHNGVTYDFDMARKDKMPEEARAYFVEMGRQGGKVGGSIRASNMTPEQRTESARNAVRARWAKAKKKKTSGT